MGSRAAQPTLRWLIPGIGSEAHKLPLHRIDLREIGRDEVIAAALAVDCLKTAAGEGQRRTWTAEMDEGGEILLLLRVCGHVGCAAENGGDIAVQIHGRELDGVAGDRAD